ncbi:hypothetical protein BIFGAL_02687 [Bifidobacterium gallicum DSM 20093 = LMG 11596]|uniref:Uncharacterized protein n=1 Tax=Bifidobacterium gallicum DSM 20093 = LMG 11596 TaxID=561180 RepID=D1NSD1_9BIFI|nr:hypothetical protein BIFGAL_02687 [Bifidobacterium gallicum DSM 20093 = LMG 11596]
MEMVIGLPGDPCDVKWSDNGAWSSGNRHVAQYVVGHIDI